MSEKLCEVCDRERTPIGEPGCHRHASFPGQAGYLECYRLGCERLPAALAAAEERGRRAGIEEAQLGTCRVYIHGCADGRAASEARPNWREYALPHPKRENCTDWVALAPRDSGKVCKCDGDSTSQFWDGGHLPDCPVVAPSEDRK